MFLYNFVKKHHITKRIFVSYFVGFSVILYFVFCTIFGPKGLVEYFSLRDTIGGRQAIKKELSSQAKAKQDKVDGMNINSLDIDLLDEQARRNLGYSGKNEVLLYQDKEASSESSLDTDN